MKRLRENQPNPCIFCKEAGVRKRAVWRSHGFYETACDDHKDNLDRIEQARAKREQRYTEADHQSWGRM